MSSFIAIALSLALCVAIYFVIQWVVEATRNLASSRHETREDGR